MVREAIQLKTNRQLQQNNCNLKKGKGLGPDPWAALTDKGTRVLTTEVAKDIKKKAKAKFEAELEAINHGVISNRCKATTKNQTVVKISHERTNRQ